MDGDGLKKTSSAVGMSKKNSPAPKSGKQSGENKQTMSATSTSCHKRKSTVDSKSSTRATRGSPVPGRRSPKSSRRNKGANGKTQVATSVGEKKSTKPIDKDAAAEEESKSPIRTSYSSEELVALRESDLAKMKPPHLDPKFETSGIWNVDAWMLSLSENSDSVRTDIDDVKSETFKSFSESVSLVPRSGSGGFACSKTSDKKSSSSKDDMFSMNLEFRPRATQGKGGTGSRLKEDWRRGGGHKDGKKNRDGKSKVLNEENFRYQSRVEEEEEEEPEWMTFGPTSQMEFIELKGFDDDDELHKRRDENEKESEEDHSSAQNDGAVGEHSVAAASASFNFEDFFKSEGHSVTEKTAPPVEDFGSSRFTQWFSGAGKEENYGEPAASVQTEKVKKEPPNGSSMPLLLQHLMQSAQNEKNPQMSELPKQNVMDVENVEKMLQGEQNAAAEAGNEPKQSENDASGEKISPVPPSRVPASFLPTSVIKQMHNEGNLQPGILSEKSKSPEPRHYHSSMLDDQQRAFRESQMKQREYFFLQHRAREELLYQQLYHERRREMQRRALVEAEYRRRQAMILSLRKFAIERGIPPDLDPRILYEYYHQYQLQQQQQRYFQQQQQRNLSPMGNAAAAAAYSSLSQHLARAGVRNTTAAASYHQGVFPGVASSGRNSPVLFTGTPPPSLRPIPKHPLQGNAPNQETAAGPGGRGAGSDLSKWFGGGDRRDLSSQAGPVEDEQSID